MSIGGVRRPSVSHGNYDSGYRLYAHCRRCDTTYGPMGSWPQQCLTPGCGDNSQMVRVDEDDIA